MRPTETKRETFRRGGVLFDATTYSDGSTQLVSLHPYDFTEYHWARLRGNGEDDYWETFREGRFTGFLSDFVNGDELTHEDVADSLLELDRRAGLKARIDHT